MTQDEYKLELAKLSYEFEEKKRSLIKRCALENNPYKEGDIITDHAKSIQIQKIAVTTDYNGMPQCVYDGIEMKKDGTPKKSGVISRIWQNNIKPENLVK